MSRATRLYILMIVFGAAGIWAVLAASETIQARPHLSGHWELTPASFEVHPGSLDSAKQGPGPTQL